MRFPFCPPPPFPLALSLICLCLTDIRVLEKLRPWPAERAAQLWAEHRKAGHIPADM